MIKLKVSYILYCLLIILPIYQDSPLAIYMGAAGYTFLMPVCFASWGIIVLLKGNIHGNNVIKRLIKLGNWLMTVTIGAIIVWLLLGNPLVIVGENIFIKGIKVWLQYITYPVYMTLIIYCIQKNPHIKKILSPFFLTHIALAIICMIESMQLPYAFENIHFTAVFPYYRIRLLTQESSWTALSIIVYGGMSIYYGLISKKRLALLLSIIANIILIVLSDSKSVLISLGFVLPMYFILSFLKNKKKNVFIKLPIFILACVFFAKLGIPKLATYINNDIMHYTSIATRIYTLIVGFLIGIIFPFGAGGSVSLGIFQYMLKRYLPFFENLPIRLKTSEIIILSNAMTDVSLTVKSGLFQFNMYWGICGTVYFIIILRRVSKSIINSNILHAVLLQTIFWTSVFLITFASNLQFEFWMLMAVLVSISRLYQKRLKDENNNNNNCYL